MHHTRISMISTLSLSLVLAATLGTAPLVSTAHAGAARKAWRAAPEGTLKVTQLVLARQVVDRQPLDLVGDRPVEADGERVYGFIRVFNKGPATMLTMVWRRDGRVVHRYRLEVGRSPAWHTWSLLRATRANTGRWTVAVVDAGGASLAEGAVVIGR
jgi:hypothetical protein